MQGVLAYVLAGLALRLVQAKACASGRTGDKEKPAAKDGGPGKHPLSQEVIGAEPPSV